MHRRLKTLFLHAFVAMAFAFAQQSGIAHLAAHLAGQTQGAQQDKTATLYACDECLSFAKLQGSAPEVTAFATARFGAVRGFEVPESGVRISHHPAFRSRAPPFIPV
ncbi:MAG: hypothetical protein JNL33_07485 [Betaproteobacteria bacterium]|nr:hypothetical protein [Betaproteobacteria bacterium]